jgi:broad specificity phosphatase PhoE
MRGLPLIYLVRHGQTDWNAEGRLQGQADTDMNAVGLAQAEANGERLSALVADHAAFDFVASPMRRTRETMERIRRVMGLPAQGYRTDPRLVEVHFGDWQGSTFAELERVRPGCTAERERDKWRFVPPGAAAESYEMLSSRVAEWLGECARPTICVAHGGVVRAVFRVVGGMDGRQSAAIDVPQDRILRIEAGRLDWL